MTQALTLRLVFRFSGKRGKAVTTKRFFCFALTSPLWLPLLFSPLVYFDLFEGLPALPALVGLLLASLVIGGIPYVIFLWSVFLHFQQREMHTLRIATWFFPLLFAGVIALLAFILGMAGNGNRWNEAAWMAAIFGGFSLVFGYGYVLLTEISYRLLCDLKIIIDPHTLERCEERGASVEEIEDTIVHGIIELANGNRKAKYKVYDFNKERNGKFYEQKRIKVVFVEEENEIVTVTVIVYYGKWNNFTA